MSTHDHDQGHGQSHAHPRAGGGDTGSGGADGGNGDGSAGRPNPAGKTPRSVAGPVFAQPQPTADPTTFVVKHPSDDAVYKEIDELNKEGKIHPLPFPAPRGGTEPVLTLEQVFGGNATAISNITANGQIVFHAVGDCGNVKGPRTQNEVSDKMVSDFNETTAMEVPQFFLMLGDVIYNFGEAKYYYDQFYEPYRDYPGPILACAGNHDGMVSPEAHVASLEAFERNFCAETFEISPDAGTLMRTAQIQPGVFFTFDAPFVRILVVYSNMLEDPGVIQDATIGQSQIDFLEAALTRVKAEAYGGALLFAHHHPPYTAVTGGDTHGWSVQMLADMDAVCEKVGVWPHAVLSGHVHNYQRFTRTRPDGTLIPYLACGNGGHNVQKLTRKGDAALRVPQIIQAASPGKDQVTFEAYDDLNYGYLRLIVDPKQLRVEYHAASDGPDAKAPDDSVTIELGSRQMTHYTPNDLGRPAQSRLINDDRTGGRAGPRPGYDERHRQR
jgi:hypothetical protein